MTVGSDSHSETHTHRSPRVRVDALSYIDLGQSNGGMILGVSQSGLSFQGVQPLEPGHLLPLSFKLPGMKHSLKANGQVVWVNDSGKGGGLRFLEMAEENWGLLKVWIAGQMSPNAPKELAEPVEDLTGNIAKFMPEHPAEAPREELGSEVEETPVELLREPFPSALGPVGADRLAVANKHSAFLAAIPSAPSPAVEAEPVAPHATPHEKTQLMQWLLACLAASAIIGMALFIAFRGRTAPEIKVVSQSGNDALGLKLERRGTDWQVSWNRNAESVLKAIGGHLSITDGQNRKDLDLEPSELRSGSILYTPASNDVLVRLQLVGGGSDTPVSESVRVLAGGAGPSQAEKPADRATPRNAGALASSVPSGVSSGSASSSQRPAPASHSLIVLDMKKPRQPGGRSASSSAPDSGSKDIVASDPSAQLSAATRGIDLNVRPAPAPARPDAASSPPAANPVRPAAPVAPLSSATAPQLITAKEPVLPPYAREMAISGTVIVHFRIETDGSVSHAIIVKGNPMLGKAAVNAVMARRYRPATLGGNPVESESDATFVFSPK